uniref:Protein FAM50 n=1 Tax=Tetraselmis sp. GSL018 TaxID=582737 RepID=A0A061RG92_9CHLO|mmetsp:Transcript_25622/g.60959  ORF Transcript_25622/g.60959 Transcript_25622/m.60959 type:complete len:325 (+) Transcript_25622:168-1142(+)|eukprot:CAMPEP_0177587240 /NCGR_PEP_ID=MMETSP0419_2-20121207/5528_1 /TAXON_ID=582737 /ORGANISM="Tetraselmis sp., Strain GSL018" /LENGTH=324 /DNA_ID=CAMNT_0019077241 /DNA_START=116 /DNA_END=1090 /DNA_ORIENTATION=+
MSYIGNAADAKRIRQLTEKREQERKRVEDMIKSSEEAVAGAGLRQFGAGASEVLETVFKNETIGLQTRDQFVEKRMTLKERYEEEARRKKEAEEEKRKKEREKKKRKKEKMEKEKSKLSFADDEEDADEELDEQTRVKKLGKDPKVETDFLPDREREKEEEELRAKLKREWEEEQERIKQETLEITYSYWDGSGHRRKVDVCKGDTIQNFLRKVREQLAPEFREMRTAQVANLMYIKEDLIIPSNMTFYELIVNKARGKSGPLFNFDVHEDVRLTNDATKEKDESHAGKVVERHWYDKNKHIFPASRWETYDPSKDYGTYTIFG